MARDHGIALAPRVQTTQRTKTLTPTFLRCIQSDERAMPKSQPRGRPRQLMQLRQRRHLHQIRRLRKPHRVPAMGRPENRYPFWRTANRPPHNPAPRRTAITSLLPRHLLLPAEAMGVALLRTVRQNQRNERQMHQMARAAKRQLRPKMHNRRVCKKRMGQRTADLATRTGEVVEMQIRMQMAMSLGLALVMARRICSRLKTLRPDRNRAKWWPMTARCSK